MPFELTDNALQASSQNLIEPQIVLEIDGYDTLYGAIEILKIIRIGDPGLDIGDADFVIGGLNAVFDQESLIGLKAGTTTSIKQQLNLDKGSGDSISSMRIAIIDKDETITRNLLTPDPDFVPTRDVLGRRARIWLGFNNTAFKEDYIIIFRGTIDSVESKSGLVLLNINSPESKKKGDIFTPAETNLNGSINGSVTSITVNSTTDFLDPAFVGPSGSADTNFEYLIRIDDEVIKTTGKTLTTFTGLTRGYLGTTAATHSDDASVKSIYRFMGNGLDIALKLMLSGWEGDPFQEDVSVTNFVRISITDTVANSIFFSSLNVVQEYNLSVGDYITTTGASNGANNVTKKLIAGITVTDDGSYIEVTGVSFVEENDSAAVIDFFSQYAVFPDGAAMKNEEVDITQHLYIKNNFLNSTTHYDFRLDDTIELKTFLAEQIYNPLSAYSVPRNASSSVGIHIASLLPTSQIKTIDYTNTTNANEVSITRSTSKNFFNAVVYKYEQRILEPDKFDKIFATFSNDSRDRIDVGIRALSIDSKGLRITDNADTIAADAASRRLNKFQFGAEFITNIKINFQTGFNLEIGDVVSVDMSSLKISDIYSGTRSGDFRLFEITNKTLDVRTGGVTLELIDSNFSQNTRYGLISPSSFIGSGLSTTQFNIKQSYQHPFGTNEYKLWENYIGAYVLVRSQDFVTMGNSFLTAVDGNKITVSPALLFTPGVDYIFELGLYDNQPSKVTLIYAFLTNDPTFADGTMYYQQL